MTYLVYPLLAGLALVVATSYPAGLLAVEARNIKDHQFRMLTGTVALGALVFFYLLNLVVPLFAYSGLYRGAYGLLYWLTLGLGGSGLALSLLALWAMWETAWDLHRRAGMFGLLSGTVAGISCLIALTMILLGT